MTEATCNEMKHFIFVIICLVTFCASTQTAFAAPKKVAVYVTGQMDQTAKTAISSSVLSRLSDNKDFIPFERDNAFLEAITDEQDFQLSGEVSVKEIRAVGEKLGVDYLIVVNGVVPSDGKVHMTAKLINLTTGEVKKSVSAQREYSDEDVWYKLANNVAYRLLNQK